MVWQKQVGQTQVQLPQVEAAGGHLVPAGMFVVAIEQLLDVPGVQLPAHVRGLAATTPRPRLDFRGCGRRCGHAWRTAAPRSVPTSTRK